MTCAWPGTRCGVLPTGLEGQTCRAVGTHLFRCRVNQGANVLGDLSQLHVGSAGGLRQGAQQRRPR
jgi:hypothetical protein